MKTIEFPNDLIEFDSCCVALGNFDGVHKGHKAVISRFIEIANELGTASVVYAFKIHPKVYFNKNLSVITTNSVKEKIISETLNPDYLLFQKIDDEFLGLTPEQFVQEILINTLNAKCVVAGENYTFGKDGAGDTKYLTEICKEKGVKVEIVPLLKEDGRVLSSSTVRDFLLKGDILSANNVLGYDFFIEGEIIHGNHIGRTLGFPTINILPSDIQILPSFGVYATVTVLNSKEYKSITNVGIKPTVSSEKPIIETYIFDAEGDFYGEKAAISFKKKLRQEKKFSGLDELKKQIEIDIDEAKKAF